MTERNILLKCKHPYIIQLEEAFQSVILYCLITSETLPSFGFGILPWGRVILSSLDEKKIFRKVNKAYWCLDYFGTRIPP